MKVIHPFGRWRRAILTPKTYEPGAKHFCSMRVAPALALPLLRLVTFFSWMHGTAFTGNLPWRRPEAKGEIPWVVQTFHYRIASFPFDGFQRRTLNTLRHALYSIAWYYSIPYYFENTLKQICLDRERAFGTQTRSCLGTRNIQKQILLKTRQEGGG